MILCTFKEILFFKTCMLYINSKAFSTYSTLINACPLHDMGWLKPLQVNWTHKSLYSVTLYCKLGNSGPTSRVSYIVLDFFFSFIPFYLHSNDLIYGCR